MFVKADSLIGVERLGVAITDWSAVGAGWLSLAFRPHICRSASIDLASRHEYFLSHSQC